MTAATKVALWHTEFRATQLGHSELRATQLGHLEAGLVSAAAVAAQVDDAASTRAPELRVRIDIDRTAMQNTVDIDVMHSVRQVGERVTRRQPQQR